VDDRDDGLTPDGADGLYVVEPLNSARRGSIIWHVDSAGVATEAFRTTSEITIGGGIELDQKGNFYLGGNGLGKFAQNAAALWEDTSLDFGQFTVGQNSDIYTLGFGANGTFLTKFTEVPEPHLVGTTLAAGITLLAAFPKRSG